MPVLASRGYFKTSKILRFLQIVVVLRQLPRDTLGFERASSRIFVAAVLAAATLATACNTEKAPQGTAAPKKAPEVGEPSGIDNADKEEESAAFILENRLLRAILGSQASREFKDFAQKTLKTSLGGAADDEYVAAANRCSKVLNHSEGQDIEIVGRTIRSLAETSSVLEIQGIYALCLHKIDKFQVSKNGAVATARQSVLDGLNKSIGNIAIEPDDTTYDDLLAELAQGIPEEDLELPTELDARVERVLGECEPGSYRTSQRGEPRVCAPWTECPSDQIEIRPPTSSNDRVCSQFARCNPAVEFEQQPGTAEQERICAPISPPCNPATHFESAPPGPTNNRVCQELTVCSATQFEAVAPTPTSDRKCEIPTECTADQFELNAPTPSSDRVCSLPTDCPPGWRHHRAHTRTQDRICTVAYRNCQAGSEATDEFFVAGKGCRKFYTNWDPSVDFGVFGFKQAIVLPSGLWGLSDGFPPYYMCASGEIPDLSSQSRTFVYVLNRFLCPSGTVLAKPETHAETQAVAAAIEQNNYNSVSINFYRPFDSPPLPEVLRDVLKKI